MVLGDLAKSEGELGRVRTIGIDISNVTVI